MRGVFDAIDPDIDDNRAFAHMFRPNESWLGRWRRSTTSAERVISARFRVRECTTVTVASFPFCMSRSASGLPTIMLRPSTTTCAPLICDAAFFQQAQTAERRAGDEAGRIAQRELRDVESDEIHRRLSPDRARGRSRASSICFGGGDCTRMP